MASNTSENPLQDAELIASIQKEIFGILNEHLLRSGLYVTIGLSEGDLEEIGNNIFSYVWEDLHSLVDRDPAARRMVQYTYETYLSFKAVVRYRIANTVYYYNRLSDTVRLVCSRKIAEEAKSLTGVDINPAAQIGRKFVIDHGHGTVIGETCKIGDNCYLLQGVILGSTDIGSNPFGKRHPTLGNNVEVAGFARIFGPITIGDNVLISPHCVITTDIPSNSKVMIVNQLQITTSSGSQAMEIFGVVPKGQGKISIFGYNLAGVSVLRLVDDNFKPFAELEIMVTSALEDHLLAELSLSQRCIRGQTDLKRLLKASLQIDSAEGIITITRARGLYKTIDSLIS